MPLDPALIALLACPQCKGALDARPSAFACSTCKLLFAIEDGIPNFLLTDARPLEGARTGPAPNG